MSTTRTQTADDLLVVGDYARRTRFRPAYDCIAVQPCVHGSETCIPGTGGSHGRHSVELAFDLVGPAGAVTLTIFTGWDHPATPPGRRAPPMSAGVSFHYPEPHDYTHESECDLLPGGRCWQDTGMLLSDEPWRLLREVGEDAMWAHLATLLPGAVCSHGDPPDWCEHRLERHLAESGHTLDVCNDIGCQPYCEET